MKITPIPSAITPTVDVQGNQAPSRVESIRTFKMNTNATPLSNQQYGQAPQQQLENSTVDNINGDNQTETVEATQPLSPQLALLAKQKRALLVKDRELAKREQALQERLSGSNVIDVTRLKSEPLRVLLENGVTYEQLTEAIMAGQGNPSEAQLEARLKAIEENVEKKFVDNETRNEKAVLAEMEREANSIVSRSEEFELVRETRSIPHVMNLIERTYRQTGEVLDVTEALQLVENELIKDNLRIAKLNKIQSQLSPPQQQTIPQQRQYTGMRTLSNKDTASVIMSPKQRAMAAFYGQPYRK